MSGDWWQKSWRADPRGAAIADRHYNRQKIGAAQFVPPGRCLVLRHDDDALWVTSWPFAEYVKHDWPGAWINSTFHLHESDRLASELIVEAVAHTRAHFGDPPPLGMVTFVDPSKVRSTNPGYCYLRAGFRRVGTTKGGLPAFQLLPDDMPPPLPARHAQLDLLALGAGTVTTSRARLAETIDTGGRT